MQSRRNGRSPGRKTDRLASMYLRATNPAYRPRKRNRAERTPPKNRKKKRSWKCGKLPDFRKSYAEMVKRFCSRFCQKCLWQPKQAPETWNLPELLHMTGIHGSSKKRKDFHNIHKFLAKSFIRSYHSESIMQVTRTTRQIKRRLSSLRPGVSLRLKNVLRDLEASFFSFSDSLPWPTNYAHFCVSWCVHQMERWGARANQVHTETLNA